MRSLVSISVGTFLLLVFAHANASAAGKPLDFNRDIKPILSDKCFLCHGPDPKTREADLRLDVRDGATADLGGYAAIVPGKPDASAVWERITSDDPDLKMPPPKSGRTLSAMEIERLRQWIEQGAKYEPHWSFQPVRRPPIPEVRGQRSEVSNSARLAATRQRSASTDHGRWTTNPIDAFVLARLEEEGIQPSPEAERATLIRRASLDLIGLPPTPEEVAAFVADDRPDAYERLLDRLLANPHFGERWGRHWLDQARYADSNGYAIDGDRVMWPYRDWVIRALNADMPFDQFTIEQLAGDLPPSPSLDQQVATGFHRNTLINTEGGTKPDQFRVEQVKDRVDTTGVVWLGLTVGCAQCHTHKYDPIEHREYYELYAFFDSTTDNNSVTPTIPVPTPEQERRTKRLKQQIAAVKKRLEQPDPERKQRQATWERQLAASAAEPPQWTTLESTARSRHKADFHRLDDGSLLAEGTNQADEEYTVTAPSPLASIFAVRLEAMTHDSLPKTGPGRASNGNFVLSEITLTAPDGRPLRFAEATADHSQPGYPVANAIDGQSNTGWAINQAPEGGLNYNRVAVFVLSSPLSVEPGQPLTITMDFNNGNSPYNLGRFRLSVSATAQTKSEAGRRLAEIAALSADKRSPEQQKQLEEAFLAADPNLAPIRSELKQLESELDRMNKAVPTAMVMRELPEPRETHVQIRGDFLRPGETVLPDVPDVLPHLSAAGESRRTRLDLARWLVREDNPLTPRVWINRIWMRLFGQGLVETENDFGTQGSPPTHPELLDWLASESIRRDWSTKQMLKEIMLSATYRQSSNERLDLAKVDPENKLLARQARLRVEAEVIRDLGLAVSGLLGDKIGGPSVYPPQPDGVYAFTQVAKKWNTSTAEDRYRRGLYTFFYRSVPHPMLSTFDVPKFNTTCTRRDRSNTPLQSLTLANDEALLEMSQALGRRLCQEVPATVGDDARLTHAVQLCLSREPEPRELARLRGYLAQQRQRFAKNSEAANAVAPAERPPGTTAAESAAWTMVARVLLNLDEFITRE